MTVTTTDQAAPTIAAASTQTQGNTTSTQADTPTKQYLKLAGLILGLSTVLLLMLLAFVTPLLNSGAKDLPLAVGGPEAVTTQITQGLQAKSPDAFDVSTYSTAEEATQAVKDRDAIGAITAGPEGVTIVTASGAGSPYVQLLKQMGAGMAESGQHVNYVDVAPMTAKDPTGSALTALAMPMIFGGMSSAAIFSMVFKNSRAKQLIGALGVAILGGLVASSVLYFGFDALEANFWPTTGVIILGI
ncbi:ABC transporter permease, partial [Corynebacterium durum]